MLTLSTPGEAPLHATWDLGDQLTLGEEGNLLVFRRS